MGDTVVTNGAREELSHLDSYKYLRKQQRITAGLMELNRKLSLLNGFTETHSESDAGLSPNTGTSSRRIGTIQFGRHFRRIIWGMQDIVDGVKEMVKDIIIFTRTKLKGL